MVDGRTAGPRLRDLGPLAIDIDGRTRPPGGPRAAAALALLLIQANRRVSADALRAALWGDEVSGHAATTLDTHLFRLRKVLEPHRRPGESPEVLVADTGGYRLILTADQADSLRLATLADQAAEDLRRGRPDRAARLAQEGLTLWRGRPFEPVSDEPWAAAAVAQLEERHAQLRETRVEALLAAGDAERALAELEPLLADHPLRERLWQFRMLAAHRCGRVDDALDTFRRARRTLLDELGLEPGPDLVALHTRILAGDDLRLAGTTPSVRPARAVTPVDLPRQRGTFLGRDDDLRDLVDRCRRHRMLTLTGAAGAGKTRLAVEAARHLVDEYTDGIRFVDLTTVQDSGEVADTVAIALGLAPGTAGTALDRVRSAVRDRRMLIVLDNCEHVLEAAADLVDVLTASGPELTVLATSREPLQAVGEEIVSLEPLTVPPDDNVFGVESLARAGAVLLFLDRSAAVIPEGPDQETVLGQVAAICRAVDGLPLAVELAAARTRAFSLPEILRQVSADPTSLHRIGRGAADHQQSLHLTVEWSHRLLTATEQAVHRRLSIVTGPVTATGAARLTGLSPADTDRALAGLVHKSMLIPLGPGRADGPSLFGQLATMRAHGRHQLRETHEENAARRELQRWVVDLVGAKPRLGHHDEKRWFAELDDDLAAIRTVLHHTLREHQDPVGAGLAGRLTMYFYHRGLMAEAGRWCTLARALPDATDLDRVLVTFGLAATKALSQHMDEAVDLIAAARHPDTFGDRDQDLLHGDSLIQLAGGLQLAGNQSLAAELAHEAAEIAARHHDLDLSLLARARLCLDPFGPTADQAAAIHDEAVAARNQYAAYLAANAAVLTATIRQDPATALTWSDRIIDLHRRHTITLAPVAIEMRANLFAMAGDHAAALRLYSAARTHNLSVGLPWPSRDNTAELLAHATAQVDRATFDDAWQQGRDLTLADL